MQCGTILKRAVTKYCKVCGDSERGQGAASGEGVVAKHGNVFDVLDHGQFCTSIESIKPIITTTVKRFVIISIIPFDKTFAIEIPFRPNRPLVQKLESATNGFITLDLKAFADGSETYTIAYTGLASGDTHTFTVTANALDTILNNISKKGSTV